MTQNRINRQIENATRAVGKKYDFSPEHPSDQPVDLWFQETPEGTVLFVVFYTLACRYSACMGCNLPATSSPSHVDFRRLMQQVDSVFSEQRVLDNAERIRKVIVSNQGSVLDEATFSSTALMYLLAKINLHLPRSRVLCFETRPEYIDAAELEFLARAIKEARDAEASIEIAIGFEAFDEEVRNQVFRKGLSLSSFERVAELVARHQFKLKCYFMQKPVPGMSDEEAIADVQRGIDYLAEVAAEYGLDINMHLNPTYAARGTDLEDAFRAGTFVPPKLTDVARAVWHARDKEISVFVGLNDEGLAVEGGSFIRPGEESLRQRLAEFNATGDFQLLESYAGRQAGSP